MTTPPRPLALVTGASRGIGRCAAIALARAGCDVVITARTVREGEGRADSTSGPVTLPGSLDTTARDVANAGGRAHAVVMDLLDRRSVEAMVAAALDISGTIDILVNNAIYQGPGPMELLGTLSLDDAETTIRADYLHQLLLIQRVLPQMLARGRGCVVNMSSGTAYLDPPAPAGRGGWGVAYAASKAALTRIVPVLHVEHGADGIRAFNVDPGFVVNERMRATAGAGQFTDAGFRGVPPEVPGAVIAWLATDPAADDHAGTLVHAQKLCRQLGLVPGWPPTPAS
ncbi:MAG TPA: SDR family oxidoreductase [Acidimicrobiales bacterium]|nr:SDR family oxidoreductase [Acidimicrobiales bacterium]